MIGWGVELSEWRSIWDWVVDVRRGEEGGRSGGEEDEGEWDREDE